MVARTVCRGISGYTLLVAHLFSYNTSFQFEISILALDRSFFFFLNDPAPPEISTLPLHAPLPICPSAGPTSGNPASASSASTVQKNRAWTLPCNVLCSMLSLAQGKGRKDGTPAPPPSARRWKSPPA